MKALQKFVDQFGLGISKKELTGKAYWAMKAQGHDVCIVNEKYLEMDGVNYQFIKSKAQYRWIVKSF